MFVSKMDWICFKCDVRFAPNSFIFVARTNWQFIWVYLEYFWFYHAFFCVHLSVYGGICSNSQNYFQFVKHASLRDSGRYLDFTMLDLWRISGHSLKKYSRSSFRADCLKALINDKNINNFFLSKKFHINLICIKIPLRWLFICIIFNYVCFLLNWLT